MLLIGGLGAAFLAVTLLLAAVASGMAQRRQVYRSLRAMRTSEVAPTDVRRQQLAVPALSRVFLPALRRVGAGVRRFTPVSVIQRLDDELVYAGSPAGWDGERMLATKVAVSALLFLGGLALPGLTGSGALRGLILGPLLAVVGYYLPEWILRSRSSARQYRIQRALPDALDLLSITVAAGLAFDAALERVAREMGGPLGDELVRVVQEMRLGKGRSDALRDLADRSTVDELKSFVLAMVQADIFGISVARVLSVQAQELRTKRRQRAEEQAQKLPVKIIFPLLFCIFPALFVVILGPAAIRIYDTMISQ